MLSLKLAIKNLLGAGLRTFLNVAVLSFALVLIIFYNGMLDGWNMEARTDTIDWEYGGGQLWEADYDPYDPFTLIDAHSPIPNTLQAEVAAGKMTPILVTQASIFPEGRMQTVMLKGLDKQQQILALPTAKMVSKDGSIPAIIGKNMAINAKLKIGDRLMVRWRDKNGTFDALDFTIADIFKTDVPTVDGGQLYIPLENMYELTGMQGEASYFVAAKDHKPAALAGWSVQSQDFLLSDLDNIIASEKISSSVLYLLLLIIALLAIFDTQILAIFRRQKEIGTYIALGMTRKQVVALFTIEGGANSILAVIFGFIWGAPLLYWVSKVGIPMGENTAVDFGVAMSERITPYYGFGLIVGTILLIIISSTIVSFIPARKIAHMKPTDALKGKLQ